MSAGRVSVDLSAAMHVCDRHRAVPRAKRLAHEFWKTISVLALLAGPAYAFWSWTWYWAIAGLVAGAVIASATRKSAAAFVLETARENPEFRAEMIAAGVIRYEAS